MSERRHFAALFSFHDKCLRDVSDCVCSLAANTTTTSHANQTAAHQASSVINASQQQPSTENGTMRQTSIPNNTNSSNNVAPPHQLTGIHSLASVPNVSNAPNPLDSHAIFTSSISLPATSTAINNTITNSVSPTNSIVSARAQAHLRFVRPSCVANLNLCVCVSFDRCRQRWPASRSQCNWCPTRWPTPTQCQR